MNPKKQPARSPLSFATRALARALLAVFLFAWSGFAAADALPNAAEMARWITQMKSSARGPFDGIFWFCQDGEILPPAPYACTPHGGGIQHGRLSERARTLREAGFMVGNVLAATDPDALVAAPGQSELKSILLERYLVAEDNGWILRRARYYRGAFQVENEYAASKQRGIFCCCDRLPCCCRTCARA